jgi:hypothetical protein
MKTAKPKKAPRNSKRGLTAARFDELADSGTHDILEHLDLSTVQRFAPGEERLDLTPTKVNIDFPRWMVEGLDHASDRVGVPRQSLIKMWLAERLQRA